MTRDINERAGGKTLGFGERLNDSVSPKKVEGIDEEVWVGLDFKKRVFLIPPEWNGKSGRTPDKRYRKEDINEKMVINGKQYTGGILNNYKNAYPLVDTKISEMVAGNQEGVAVKAVKAPVKEPEPEPEPAVAELHKGGGRKKYRKSKRRNSKRRNSKRRKSKKKTNKRRKRR